MLRSFILICLLSTFFLRAAENEALIPPEGSKAYNPQPLMEDVRKRVQTDKYRFVVVGDTKHATTFIPLVKLMEEKYNPDFVITTGDMVMSGGGTSGPGFWEKFSMDSGAAMRRRPWWPAIGNHELAGKPITKNSELTDDSLLKANQTSGVENFKQFYGLDSEYYSFSFRNAVFMALPWRVPKGSSLSWLKDELKKARDQKVEHIFIFNHSPFYTVGMKDASDIPNTRTAVTELFTEYGVRAVFSGHDHGYYRTFRDAVPYMISAGGGAKLYPALRQKEALPEDVWYHVDPNVVTIDPDSGNLSFPAEMRYILHRGGQADRVTTSPDQFFIVIDVDGSKVQATCINNKDETMDTLTLIVDPAVLAQARERVGASQQARFWQTAGVVIGVGLLLTLVAGVILRWRRMRTPPEA